MTLKLEVGPDEVDSVTGQPMNEVTMRGAPAEIGALKEHPGFKQVIESPSVRIPEDDMEPQPDTESGESVLAIRLIGKQEDIQFAVKMFDSIVTQVAVHAHDRQRVVAEARASTVVKTPIGEALRKKLVELLSEDAPLTPNMLSKIIRMAESGRDLLAAEKITLDQLGLIGRRRRRNPYGGLINGGDLMGGPDDDLDGVVGMGQLGGALAPAPPVENFGMQAIREMVEGLRTANDSPVKLIEALAAARSAGLHDAAAVLEKKLGIDKPPTAVLRGPGAKPAIPALPATINDGNGTREVPARETCKHCQWPKISHDSDGKRHGCPGFESSEEAPRKPCGCLMNENCNACAKNETRGLIATPAFAGAAATLRDENGTQWTVPPREVCKHCKWPKISHYSDTNRRDGCPGFEPVEAPPEVSGPAQGTT